MAEAAKKPDHEGGEGGGITGEYSKPDAAKAFDIYDKQIKPKIAAMDTIKGDLSQPYDDIKQHAHFPRRVLNFIISLEGEEDAKRDHMLLALAEGLKHRKLFLPRDLVTMAKGEDGGSAVPTGERPKPKLATVPKDDADLADPSGEQPAPGSTGAAMMDALKAAGEPFTEATAEELAQQEGRGAAGD